MKRFLDEWKIIEIFKFQQLWHYSKCIWMILILIISVNFYLGSQIFYNFSIDLNVLINRLMFISPMTTTYLSEFLLHNWNWPTHNIACLLKNSVNLVFPRFERLVSMDISSLLCKSEKKMNWCPPQACNIFFTNGLTLFVITCTTKQEWNYVQYCNCFWKICVHFSLPWLHG